MQNREFFFLFRATPAAYGSSQARGLNRSCSCRSTPQPQAQPREIRAKFLTYVTAHCNAGSLTHRARPETEHPLSWLLVGFFTAEPGRKLKQQHFRTTGWGGRMMKEKTEKPYVMQIFGL